MRCPKCGKEISGESKYCNFCGEKTSSDLIKEIKKPKIKIYKRKWFKILIIVLVVILCGVATFLILKGNANKEWVEIRDKVRQLSQEGSTLYKQAKYQEAIAKYDEAINLRNELNSKLIKDNKYSFPFKPIDSDKLIKINDFAFYLDIYNVLCFVYRDNKDMPQHMGYAEESAKKTIEILNEQYSSPIIDKRLSGAYVTLGDLYNVDEQYDLAITTLNKAIELNSENADAYTFLCKAYYLRRNESKESTGFINKTDGYLALGNCMKALKLEPDNVIANKLQSQINDYLNP